MFVRACTSSSMCLDAVKMRHNVVQCIIIIMFEDYYASLLYMCDNKYAYSNSQCRKF